MKCHQCKKEITKQSAVKMVTEHANGQVFEHIIRREDPPDSPIVRVWHQKCWYISGKRLKRGGHKEKGRLGPSFDPYKIEEAIRSGATVKASEEVRRQRQETIAAEASAAIEASRQQDPGHSESRETDWRDQRSADVSELPSPDGET